MHDKLAAALRRVGARIMDCRREGNTHGRWKGAQYKANADMIADASMRECLRQITDLSIVSEEDVASQSEQRPNEYWLIDPIDGTASFAHGFPGFVCQAALMCDGLPQMAGVYAPALDKLYMAIRGGGATLNGLPIRVRMVDRKQLIMVDNYPKPRGVAERLMRDLYCAKYLESGSIGLKICLVAEGQADVFVKDVQVRDWDVAAPHLVLQEAGGILVQFNNQPFDYRGGYERHGLIAVPSVGLLDQLNEIIAGYGVKS
jgi:3'(2'), 5'-bisphosphate nucleotidase